MVNGSDIVNYAKKFINVPYKFGGSNPSGFDCSGLVQYVYNNFGIHISRTTKTQINDGKEVGRNQLQLGDLVFPSNNHVTIYIGNGQVLHAPQPGESVKISKLWAFWRARRILGDEACTNTIKHTQKIPTGIFTFHSGTCLHKTGDNFEYLVGDYNQMESQIFIV